MQIIDVFAHAKGLISVHPSVLAGSTCSPSSRAVSICGLFLQQNSTLLLNSLRVSPALVSRECKFCFKVCEAGISFRACISKA